MVGIRGGPQTVLVLILCGFPDMFIFVIAWNVCWSMFLSPCHKLVSSTKMKISVEKMPPLEWPTVKSVEIFPWLTIIVGGLSPLWGFCLAGVSRRSKKGWSKTPSLPLVQLLLLPCIPALTPLVDGLQPVVEHKPFPAQVAGHGVHHSSREPV